MTIKLNLDQTIAAMLTENTGTHMLDSGGAAGRAWQQNLGLTVDDFKAQPSATADIYVREYKGETVAEVIPCVNVFHLLTAGCLELDEYCDDFNAIPVDDWKGDHSGVSFSGQQYLDTCLFTTEENGGFNTYNWAANHSTVFQGAMLERECEYGPEKYILIQIHGGADVRGGYTDAKLFKLDDGAEFYNVVTEDCGFGVELKDMDSKTPDNYLSMSWHGEWINNEGGCGGSDAELLEFATACGATLENPSVTVSGDAYLDF